MPYRALKHAIAIHVDEVSALASARSSMASCSSLGLKGLYAQDLRIEAHLDGLRVDCDAGWQAALVAVEAPTPGAIFPATVLALESGAADRLEALLTKVLAERTSGTGFLAACGWLSYAQSFRTIKTLLDCKEAFSINLGVAAAGIHRQDPGPKLLGAIQAEDPALRAHAWRVAGRVRRRDVLGSIWKAYSDDSPDVCFSSGCAGLLLGDLNGIPVLQEVAVSKWARREEAAVLAAQVLEPARARAWHDGVASRPGLGRVAVAIAGAIGDPVLVPWLLGCLERPELARVAAHALSTITGLRIVVEGLEGKKPEGFEAGPTDDPADENVAMDPDEFLPWPDPEKTRTWWNANGSKFRTGIRHLLGRPISPETLRQALIEGTQRQRAAAAFELAWLDPTQPLFEVRAPAVRQMQALGIAPSQ